MNNKISLLKFEFISTIFILIFGFLSHYLYDIFNQNIIIGIFSPINESVWEHLKLTFFPCLITILIGYFYYKDLYPDYLKSKTKSIIYALLFTIISFYTYSGILGHHLLFMDILIFIISCFMIFILTLKNCNGDYANNKIYFFILFLIFLLFLIFTFNPLDISLFK